MRTYLIVRIKGKDYKLSKLSNSIRKKLFTGEIKGRLGVKKDNKVVLQ